MRDKNQRTILTTLLVGGFLVASSSLGVAEEDVAALKQQIKQLQERVEQLEAQQGQAQPGPTTPFFNRGWDPFAEMERMQRQMDQLFSNAFTQTVPQRGIFTSDMVFDQELNLQETDNGYEIRFDMAGLDKENIDIQINKNSITVSGKYSEEHKTEEPNAVMRSQRFGTFLKTIPLPVDADTANVKTEQKGDELVIRMPKKS